MSPRTRLILIFAGKAVGILIAISVVWGFFIVMPYNRALVAVTDTLSGAEIILGEDFPEADRLRLGLKEDSIYVGLEPGPELYGYLEGPALQYGMLLIISLIAATPALGWRRRLKFIPLALVIMFVIQVCTILGFARVSLSGQLASANPFVILFITLGTALFPTLIWGILCYKYWWPRTV